MNKIYKAVYLFCGIGGGALGFQRSKRTYRGLEGRFETLVGIDCDPEACTDFEYLTGAKAVKMDLFSRAQYRAWHGHEPPEGWREATAEDLRAAAGGQTPDVVFTSPPCKGFSALLPAKSAGTEKYQALNELTIRGFELTLEAWSPAIILMENVPRIKTRGEKFLRQIRAAAESHSYVWHDGGEHNLGKIGGLGQERKRYLFAARNPRKLASFVYKPVEYPLKSIGDVIAPLPLPGQGGGRMHRLPNLHWITWLRLALIPAGGDWRDLETCGWEGLRIQSVPRGEGISALGVLPWDKPAGTITGNMKLYSSSPAAVQDPRFGDAARTHNNVFRITRWGGAAQAVTGADGPNSGAMCVADPRMVAEAEYYHRAYRVTPMEETAGTITGGGGPSSGTIVVADNRMPGKPPVWAGNFKRTQKTRVYGYDETAGAITGSASVHGEGVSIIADPRPGYGPGRHGVNLKVSPWEETAGAVTGAEQPSCGALSICDPRVQCKSTMAMLGVMDWREPSGAVSAAARPSCGSTPDSIADPRLHCEQRSGSYGVQAWEEPAATVSSAGIDSGAAAVADVRIPEQGEAGVWVIIALDGTWHRPLTTYEKAMLQDFPAMVDGRPLQLCGNSEQRWNERVGNAVPVGAATGMGNAVLDALLANEYHEIMYSSFTALWVKMLARARFMRMLAGRE